MNRFRIVTGREGDFEDVWKSRKSSLEEMVGFQSFHLLRGATNRDEGFTLYVSHSVWRREADFVEWTRSRNFRDSHRSAGKHRTLYLEPPQFEGFNSVEGA